MPKAKRQRQVRGTTSSLVRLVGKKYKFGHPKINFGREVYPFQVNVTTAGVTSEPGAATLAGKRFLLPRPLKFKSK